MLLLGTRCVSGRKSWPWLRGMHRRDPASRLRERRRHEVCGKPVSGVALGTDVTTLLLGQAAESRQGGEAR